MTTETYDVIVIGDGSAGENMAQRTAKRAVDGRREGAGRLRDGRRVPARRCRKTVLRTKCG